MDTAKLELAAQRYQEAVEAFEAARVDLQAEAVAVLRRDDLPDGALVDVARITGWSAEELRHLLETVPEDPRDGR
ncbi:hypothetical protein IHE55_07370 [Streptomyces pactum]|uniref:Uncharacterized protein n=1 Tax=Streptomyces pactum TaxID=68249 RepID=A0ABS0NHF6_9ACTN|nr:hypothetical protein [Streptomyces pactum]MBH5334631.1 hypothetical protein [Streptomyces pactum]